MSDSDQIRALEERLASAEAKVQNLWPAVTFTANAASVLAEILKEQYLSEADQQRVDSAAADLKNVASKMSGGLAG